MADLESSFVDRATAAAGVRAGLPEHAIATLVEHFETGSNHSFLFARRDLRMVVKNAIATQAAVHTDRGVFNHFQTLTDRRQVPSGHGGGARRIASLVSQDPTLEQH